MKPIQILALAIAATLTLPTAAFAGKGTKEEKKAQRKLGAQYDTNANGTIDGAEIEAVRKAFDAEKNGPLKSLDTNSDSKLDDSEITALHGVKPKADGEKKKKKKKNA